MKVSTRRDPDGSAGFLFGNSSSRTAANKLIAAKVK